MLLLGMNIFLEKMYSNERYLIPIAAGSCLSCVASATKIKEIDKHQDKFEFVFQERFSDDLEFLIKEYRLEGYNLNRFLFSDSLFDRFYEVNKPPYFVVLWGNEKSAERIFFNDSERLQSLFLSKGISDTFRFEMAVFPKTTNEVLSSNDGSLYIFDQLHKNRIGYCRPEMNIAKIIVLTDTIVRTIFEQVFSGDLSMYELMDKIDLPQKNIFTAGYVTNDTLFAMSSHSFFAGITSDGDSIVRNFPYLNLFVKGKYVHSIGFDYFLRDSCSFVKPNFGIYNGRMYACVTKIPSLCIDTTTYNYFISELSLKEGRYHFERFLKYEMPTVYKKVGFGLINSYVVGNCILTNLSNQLYSLDSFNIFSLDLPHTKDFSLSSLKDNGEEVYINQPNAVLHADRIYNLVFDRKNKQYRHLVLSIDNNKLSSDTLVETKFLFPIIDKSDPKYVWLPLDTKRLVRRKVVD